MPEFTYIARDAAGEKVSGEISAATERDALSTLAGRSLFPMEIRTGAVVAGSKSVKRVPAQLRATTYSQMADLLRSGVPLLRALAVLRAQNKHAGLNYVLGEVHSRVEQGSTLAEAMARFPRIFGEMAISMIRAGGEGGFLEESLARVAEFTEAQEDIKKRTAGALAYPMVLAVVGTVIVAVLMVFFVPRFDSLFDDLRQRGELPAITDWLLWTSGLVWRKEFWLPWGILILGLAGVGGTLGWQWLGTDQGRFCQDRWKLRLPVVGGIFLSMAVARFCRVLGTLLRNGVPIVRSLEISSDAAGNRVLARDIQEASETISAGEALAGPLGSSGHFPPMVVEMIAVAEESNTLENVLVQIADSLERQTWRKLDIAVRLIEPLMLLMLASVVLVLVVALLVPILKMSMTI
jgi:general secretion pathway protein F/type IV pilus assembly protein PilC